MYYQYLFKKSKRVISFWLFLFLLSPLFSSTLLLDISSNPSRINPILASDSVSSTISGWIFNGLFKYDKNGQIINDLAKSYKFITPTHLRVKIKNNILWSDGVKFTVDDIIFTYNTINNPKIYTAIKSEFTKVKKIIKKDNYTLDIYYKEPYFKALNIWMVGFLPKHILENEKNLMSSKFNKHPIGTGPYILTQFKLSSDIILKVNKNYFGKIPKIDTIKYKFIPDPNTSFTMLKQKKLDIGGLTPLQINRQINKQFKQNFAIYESPSFGYTYMGFNLKKNLFKNKTLRKAINLAINKKQLVDILFFSHGKVCTGPFLPNTFAFNDKIKATYNPQKAKQLLKTLGYDADHPFEFTVITNANNAIRVNAAQIIQYQLSQVNIKMKIRVLEWQAFLNTVVFPRNFDAVILGWGLSLMPDARSIWHSKSDKKGGFNFVGYNNKIVDENIELAEKTTNTKELSKLYKEIFTQISNDLPYIFLYIPNSITAVSKDIQNVSPSLIGVMHNEYDWVKP